MPSPEELSNKAPGFIDHVPTQEELEALVKQIEISETTLTAGALKAIRQGEDAGMHPADLNQAFPNEAPALASPVLPIAEQRTPAPVYEESPVDSMRMTRAEIAQAVQNMDQPK
jgi:hypothetical protein